MAIAPKPLFNRHSLQAELASFEMELSEAQLRAAQDWAELAESFRGRKIGDDWEETLGKFDFIRAKKLNEKPPPWKNKLPTGSTKPTASRRRRSPG